MRLLTAAGPIALDRCLVVGIVNRTPDSFYDGGRMGLDEATDHALRLDDEGADLLDVGAVKAGPGDPVPEDEEAARLIPLVRAIAARTNMPISVETGRPEVAAAALDAGAAIVNDVTGLADEKLAVVVAEHGAALILMHHGGQIRGRPRHPVYSDVVAEVAEDLANLAERAQEAGVGPDSLVIDPGLDFGKTTFHSLEIMRRLDELTSGRHPVLVAPSRKDVIGETLDVAPEERLEGTLALVTVAVMKGAAMVRVHDVKPATRTVRMAEAVMGRLRPAAPVRGLWD